MVTADTLIFSKAFITTFLPYLAAVVSQPFVSGKIEMRSFAQTSIQYCKKEANSLLLDERIGEGYERHQDGLSGYFGISIAQFSLDHFSTIAGPCWTEH
jgi:hypothetical protein